MPAPISLDCRRWAHPPDKVAIVQRHRHVTYADLCGRASRLAGHFHTMGYARHNVAFLLHNSIESVCGYLACSLAGVTAVPLHPRSTGDELFNLLRSAEAEAAVVHEDQLAYFQSLLGALSSVRVFAIEELISTWASPFPERPSEDANRESAPVVIFHTSGSTRRPKGVVYSHATLRGALSPFFSASFTRRFDSEELVYLNVAMMSDTVGCIHALWTLIRGGRLVVLHGFDADEFLEAVANHRPTHSTLFLPHAFRLSSDDRVSTEVFRGFRMLCFAGDRTPVELIQKYADAHGIVPLVGYGLTESFVVALNLSSSPAHFGSMGRPVEGVDVRIVDGEGRDLPPGATGEIVVKSPQNFVEYWRAPAATRAVWLAGGWFKTGDVARVDEAGYLWFSGRKKQIIIRGGENLSPLEIEEALYRHPAVKLAGVVGMPHPDEGEVPVAYVELEDGQAVSGEELKDFLAERLIYYKVPAQVHVVDKLPLGRTGKVDRRKLRDGRG